MAKNTGKRIQTTKSSDDNAIIGSHISKSFRLPHNRQNTIKGALVNLIGGGDRTFETQEVLRDVSFKIKKGEFFGIVGRNGSGKSTLLKMLAGIYKPTKGEIIVNGSLTPFIELGVGFNPELTGRENVYLNGALLGFSDRDVSKMYEDIVAFAELERFMDQKLKNYSSGMQVRLAFSIAIRAQSDILILDEVLAVGDEAFQQKCLDVFQAYKNNPDKTVILVTHNMEQVKKFCDRALLINKGKILLIGDPQDVSNEYSALNVATDVVPQFSQKTHTTQAARKENLIRSVTVASDAVGLRDDITLTIHTENNSKKDRKIVAGINISKINDPYNSTHAEYNSYVELGDIKVRSGEKKNFQIKLNGGQLYKGDYIVKAHFLDAENDYKSYINDVEYAKFSVTEADKSKSGAFNLSGRWEVSK